MITRELPPNGGGIGYYVYNLSKKLVERGHKVTIITRGSTEKTKKRMVDGIDVFEASFFPLYPFHILIHSIFVNMILKSIEPKLTLVHLHTPLPPPVETSLPTIITVHTALKIDAKYHEIYNLYFLAEKVQSIVVYPRIELKLLKGSKKITAVSRSVAKELNEYGIDPNEITVVGNGVDEKVFVPTPEKKQTEKYVLYTGVLRGRKGLFDLIKCAEYVSKTFPNVKFFITGKGPLLHILKEKVRKMGLQKNIVFLGYVKRDRLIQIYQNASIHVVPSVYEGLPTVLLEAMSCGLPVVATAVGGNTEVISSGVNGFLVPPKAPQEMARVILKLLDDPKLREKIGREARKTIERYYTWDRIADNILKCYQSIL